MKKYYGIKNGYGSESSRGFSNMWDVYVFEGRQARDEWVAAHSNRLDVEAITRREIKDYIEAPKPFSGLRRIIAPLYCEELIPGCLGRVELGYAGDSVLLPL